MNSERRAYFSITGDSFEESASGKSLGMIEATSKLVLEGKLRPQLRELEREGKDLT